MKIRNTSLTLGLIAAFTAASPSFAQTATPKLVTPIAASAPTAVPSLVPYSGAAIAVDGKPPTGDRGITFQIFKEETGGEPLWIESQTVAFDSTGHYNVQLGATSPNGLPTDLFATGEARWLEVQIAGQPSQPRVLLASVPYALKAADAATLGGLPASAYALAGTRTASGAVSPAITPDLVSNVTTTGGTSGYIPVFNGASTVIDSPVFVNGANVGIGTATPTAPLTVEGNAVVSGAVTVAGLSTFNGGFVMPPSATATTAKGYNSLWVKLETSAWNSTSNGAVTPRFQWQAEQKGNNTPTPTATLNLQSSTTTTAPAETGFYFNANGTLNFAPGQTFPGVGTITGVTAGTALTGGGTIGNVTLNLDTTKVPLLASANTFTGNQGITGSETVSGSVSSASLFLPNTASTTVGLVQLGSTPFLSNYPSASSNALIGGAGNFTMTGTVNTATGFDALHANTSGVANTADGTYSLISETSGTANTAIGYDSVYRNTTGGYNVGLGYAAAFATSTGFYNTGLGTEALYYNATGQSNTAIGYFAGPDSGSTALSNSTAVGANAAVSQSNSLVLGQTTAGNPGASFVNVGVGTANPRSILEAVTTAPNVLGPTLTLTNSSSNGDFGGASIDFNTYLPSTSGTYNPSSRIEAFGNGGSSDSLEFMSNNDTEFGGSNQGLVVNMTIDPTGRVEIGGNTIDGLSDRLTVNSISYSGDSEVAAIAAFGAPTDPNEGNGSHGIYAVGGDGTGNAQADFAGDGGQFYGGYTPESSSGPGGYGIYATGGGGGVGVAADAAYLDGNVTVTGALSVSGVKHFKIDDPLDPANKYLVHASVESSEMMNIYTGNVTTDELGVATVTLPTWFQAENGDFRYQLTVIGGRFAQAIVSKEIADNKFTISTNATNVKVSWQVTAVRQDAYAKAHPMVVEETKPVYERGFYEHPELYGQPAEKQTQWGRRPQQMQRMKAMREKQKLQAVQHSTPQRSHDQPASAVNRNFPHPAAPALHTATSGAQLKPISQPENK